MKPERRKFTRFLVSENVYAALGPWFSEIGRIKEISIGGVSIKYFADGNFAQNNSYVKIFIRGEKYFLPKLPCKVIYDISIEPKADPPISGLSHILISRLNTFKRRSFFRIS